MFGKKQSVKLRVLGIMLSLCVLLTSLPVTVSAVAPESVNYPLTIKIYNPESGTTTDKTFDTSDDLLGFGINGGRSNWTYRTYRKLFFGWSTDEKFKDATAVNDLKSTDRIYRDVEPISTVLNDLDTVDENTVLYPVILPVADLVTIISSLQSGAGEFNININQADEEMFEKAELVKESSGKGDLTASERKIVAYYDDETEQYGISVLSEFSYTDLRVPFLVVENPLAVIKSAKDITDFSGLNPTGYSYEDLHVIFDENATVSTQQNNWTFSSSTFMVAAVLDKDGNVLNSTIEQPDSNSLISKFSFENPNEEKEFIIRTVVRNDNSDSAYGNNPYPSNNIVTATGEEIMKPMELYSGDWTNVTISKEMAQKAALDTDNIVEFVMGGDINGGVAIEKKNLTGGALLIAFLLPNMQTVGKVVTKNTSVYDFVPAVAKFDKNTAAFGDTDEQTIGYSVFAVNGAMNSDGFNTNTAPGSLAAKGDTFADDFVVGEKYTINGEEYIFKGWNTKADGTGTEVTKDTVIAREMLVPELEHDIVLYGNWEKKVYVALDVPITKNVVLGGNVAPTAKTFEFEVKPYGNPNADISGLNIGGTTIFVDGEGVFTGMLTISGDAAIIANAGGIRLAEKNDGAENWEYDTTGYCINLDEGNNMVITKNGETNQLRVAEFTNTYTENKPVEEEMTIDFKKIVVLGGNKESGKTTFNFEIVPNNGEVDISSLTITGNTITVNGKGEYTGTIVISGDPQLIVDAGGLKLFEKNDDIANWEYDKSEYSIEVQQTNKGYEILVQKDMGNDNPLPVDVVEFTNTYTANSSIIPDTGDNGVMMLFGTLMMVSFAGLVIACLEKRRRTSER